jgi:chain length determinant protein EpsF
LNFSRLLLVLAARRKLVAVALILTLTTTFSLSLCLPKQYKATATIVLNYKGVDPVTGFTLSAQLMPRYMATQVDIMTNIAVASAVVDQLKLVNNHRFQQQFEDAAKDSLEMRAAIAESLLKKLTVVPARESSVLDISFQDRDPRLAADVANAFALAYQRAIVKLKIEPAKKTTDYFHELVQESLVKLEKAQQDYSEFQKEHNVLSVDRGADAEAARYSELSSQLVAVQGELLAVSARSWQAQGNAAAEFADVLSNPLVQNLKSELTRAQIKLSDTAEHYGSAHPVYKAAEAEVVRLRAELDRQTELLGHTIQNSERTLRQRAAQLQSSIDAQKARILEQNKIRDALAILARRVETAQQAYTVANQRFSQASLESQSTQSDISVLQAAEPPQKPFAPNLLLNLAAGAFLGLALGCGVAFLAERSDQRVRSVADLTAKFEAPVLGVVGKYGRSLEGADSKARSALPGPFKLRA